MSYVTVPTALLVALIRSDVAGYEEHCRTLDDALTSYRQMAAELGLTDALAELLATIVREEWDSELPTPRSSQR